ncbi:MAG: hypothetical protein IPH57_01780 [Saprospiraceae bacterium]|nr:hypothetical protein [Saprospiraceae bacterium]
MDHVVYLDAKSKELMKITQGTKSMILRGAQGRKLPYGRVFEGDILYFTNNDGSGIIHSKAEVKSVINSEKLTVEESYELIEKNKEQLQTDKSILNRFGGKRYLVLISIKNFEMIENFTFDRSQFSNMDDWLLVEKIGNVMF